MGTLSANVPPATTPAVLPAPFGLLLSLKARLLLNRVNQLLDEAPVRVLISAGFLIAIWASLYLLFYRVFEFLKRFPEQTAVAVPYVFQIFFVAMSVLLAFSTAVLCYGALFAREESGFLLAGPTPPRHIVGLVYVESLFLASWSMILLGLPLMLAISRSEALPWYFFVIFIAAFAGFAPIPGALGLMAAWAVAMYFPRSPKRVLATAGAAAIGAAIYWWAPLWNEVSSGGGAEWLNRFLGQLSLLRAALLPSTWASESIRYALQRQPTTAIFYLYIIAANALFLSWLAIGVVARRLPQAYARASSRSGKQPGRLMARFTTGLTDFVFFYLPRDERLLIRKDLLNFFRDPLQWSQLAIMLGLLTLYLTYLPRYRTGDLNQRLRILYAFLNHSAITLIVSTFTSRFVFPMVSMEGRQIWLVGLWPLPRRRVLWAKLQFALAVTLFAAMSVSALSVYTINLPLDLSAILLLTTLTTCFGLCGLAIGLGARLPNYRERSAARIASGLGGTVNLVASVLLVLLTVAATGIMCYSIAFAREYDALDESVAVWSLRTVGLTVFQIVLGVSAGFLSMKIGQARFAGEEF